MENGEPLKRTNTLLNIKIKSAHNNFHWLLGDDGGGSFIFFSADVMIRYDYYYHCV